MEKDVVPALLEALQNEYKELSEDSKKLKKLVTRVTDEKATLLDAQKYAEEVGRILQKIFEDNVSDETLPDGKFYYNIAQRLLEPLLRNSYKDIANYCYDTQKLVNVTNEIGLNPVKVKYNSDRVNGIVDYVSNADSYSQVEKSFIDSLMNYSQSTYDDFIQSNAEFKYNSGMSPMVIRTAVGKACKWCRNLEGEYRYPNVPKDVYRRHENCYCTVTYKDGKRYKDVWSKKNILNQDEIQRRIDTDLRNREHDAYDREIKKNLGMTINGIEIKGISEHFYDRGIEREIESKFISDALRNPLDISSIKIDEYGRPSFKIIGEYVTISMNPNTGIMITCHKTHSKLAKKLKEQRNG